MSKRTALIPKDPVDLVRLTGNIYETATVVAKRAKQIAINRKYALHAELEEFAAYTATLDVVIEDNKQVEISRRYEAQPKPVIIATEELLAGKIKYHYTTVEATSET